MIKSRIERTNPSFNKGIDILTLNGGVLEIARYTTKEDKSRKNSIVLLRGTPKEQQQLLSHAIKKYKSNIQNHACSKEEFKLMYKNNFRPVKYEATAEGEEQKTIITYKTMKEALENFNENTGIYMEYIEQ